MTANFPKRYLATITIEATSPLKIGSSDIDMLQDAPVQKDFNELPMILGTSIAGVLRKEFDKKLAKEIFGDDDSQKQDAKGSRLIISNALICDEEMKVQESLLSQKSDFLKLFDTLPIREHVRITSKGVADAKNSGKFDEEVVYAGARFKFRLELIGNEDDQKNWQKLLETINAKTFRLGGGTTKGFGSIKVLHENSTYSIYNVTSQEYAQSTSSLNTNYSTPLPKSTKEIDYTSYVLELTPDDFFMFGSGFGDDDADMTPVYEQVIDYNNKRLSEKKVLIPASSLKGAIAHRTSYHYNKNNNLFVGNSEARETISEIFGEAKEQKQGAKGKILISDCFVEKADQKIFDHVSIDRFTGGAIEGALFQEKTLANVDEFTIEILLKKGIEQAYIDAFELALQDITTGMLSLGGATTKGHGIFSGKVFKDGEAL